MKFGCCTGLFSDLILSLKEAGADYAEVGVAELHNHSMDEIKERAKAVADTGISCEAGNVLLGSADIYTEELTSFVDDILNKAAVLSMKTVVFGSGGSRRFPETMSYEDAFKRILDFCHTVLIPALERYDIICALEPLNRSETNIFNDLPESVRFVRAVDHPRFKLLCDLYHFDAENEPMADLWNAREHIAHLHIANAERNRVVPMPGDGKNYGEFFRTLKDMGYSGRISLEGKLLEPQTDCIRDSLSYIRELAE